MRCFSALHVLNVITVANAIAFAKRRSFSVKSHGHIVDAVEEFVADVPPRMQYWNRWSISQPDLMQQVDPEQKKYFFFDGDIGGLNNLRLGWEMAGLIALKTGRTLVLPPAKGFYLIDWGPSQYNFVPVENDGVSKVEDFINLELLKKGVPTVTFDEFIQEASLLQSATIENELRSPLDYFRKFQVEDKIKMVQSGQMSEFCDVDYYRQMDDQFLYLYGPKSGELGRVFLCSKWDDTGAPRLRKGGEEMGNPSEFVRLQHGHFAWRPEVFQLASKIIDDLGMWNYSSVHARYGDFQFEGAKEAPETIVQKWFTSELGGKLMRPARTVYISTDQPNPRSMDAFRDNGFRVRSSKDYFNNHDSPIADDLAQLGPVMVNKLKGPIEQVVCVFSRVFIGTGHSTFSGYIKEMRSDADAPQTRHIDHTEEPNDAMVDAVLNQIKAWEDRNGGETMVALDN